MDNELKVLLFRLRRQLLDLKGVDAMLGCVNCTLGSSTKSSCLDCRVRRGILLLFHDVAPDTAASIQHHSTLPLSNINSNIQPARIHSRNDYLEQLTLTNVSFTIILIKTVQINQMNSPFCAFSRLPTSLNYSKARGEERRHHQR
jgi:hypothetical protein